MPGGAELDIVFLPYFPAWVIVTLGLIAAVYVFYGVWVGRQRLLFRALFMALTLGALLNPNLRIEERDPLPDMAVVLVDGSESQEIGGRPTQAERTLDALRAALDKLPNVETKIVRSAGATTSNRDGTLLFEDLNRALGDVSAEQLAGVFAITDGQIHDIPDEDKKLPNDVPLHVFITGSKEEFDRRLIVSQSPAFGIVGGTVSVSFRVEDIGPNTGAFVSPTALVRLRVGGETVDTVLVPVGEDHSLTVPIEHGGQNIIELAASPKDNEITLLNNRAVLSISGVRDRLRVLLVSGEPHAGERAWRNLLKADPSVDLVHFTILRPPEKQDGTPIGELSLIAFPTRELFAEKLESFDLVIFDRYQRRGVLPIVYLANVARYVENGGALLTAVGPAFATPLSLYRTPLAGILPAQPTGEVLQQGFKPAVTELGIRHPVTTNLNKANNPYKDDSPPQWGRWFRLIDAEKITGETLMTGPDDRPVLILDRVGEGRVAQLMSDHGWLWSRGYEGGGPQAELLRRLAHWLMKEPELEEEDLEATVADGTLTVTRKTTSDESAPVTVTGPNGETRQIELARSEPGRWTGQMVAEEMGLYKIEDDDHFAIAAQGPSNPREFADVRARDDLIAPFANQTGGAAKWIEDHPFGQEPTLRKVRPDRTKSGAGWMGVHDNNQYLTQRATQHAMFPAWLVALLAVGTLIFGWYREGR